MKTATTKTAPLFLRKFGPLLGAIAFYALIMILRSADIINGYYMQVMLFAGVNVMMTASLNLVNGFTGQFCIGHAGFMSLGAYGSAVITTLVFKGTSVAPAAQIPVFLLGLLCGGIVAALVGCLIGIPSLKLKGDYLAIVTLAFGEIIRNVLNCLYISIGPGSVRSVVDPSNAAATTKAVMMDKLHIQFNSAPPSDWQVLVNGPAGATGVAKISTFVIGFALVLFTLFVVLNLVNSRSGRAIMAIRDSRIAAESVGINITKYKMMAFVTSAFLAGMAGALFGLNYSTVTASKFKFDTSILVLVFVVLGGIGNIRGSVIAAALLTVLPELLRAFADYRMLVYAVVLIVVMLATNSPALRSALSRVIPHRRHANVKKEGESA